MMPPRKQHSRTADLQKTEREKQSESNEILVQSDCNHEIMDDEKSDQTPRSQAKSPLLKDKTDQLVNPYLVFHSPIQSEISPFKKERTLGVKEYKPRVKSKYMKTDKSIRNLIFTAPCHLQNCKLGSIILTKYQSSGKFTLTYSSKQRTFINIAKCEKCFKVFGNHEALGGHKRACQKVNEPSVEQIL